MNKSIQYDPKNLIARGTTKNVYQGPGSNIVLEFTDAPGKEQGSALLAYRMTLHYFKLLQQRNLPTHFLDVCDERRLLLVRPSRIFGNGVRWIYRGVAAGSFVRRYGMYIKEGAPMLPFIETGLKDEERGDPFIGRQALQALGILPLQAYESCLQLCSNVFALVASDMLTRGLALWDMKMELGLDAEGRIMVIDEISPEGMRVYHGKTRVSGQALGAFFDC